MEEKKNYGFKFDPKKISDANGISTVNIESDDKPLDMPGNYTLANKPKKKVKGLPNIGKGSNGFAGVTTLATIIAVAGAIIAFFVLKY